MAHSLTPAPLPATVPISTASRDKSQCPSLGFQRVWLCHQGCDGDLDYKLVHRRLVLRFSVGVACFSSVCAKNVDVVPTYKHSYKGIYVSMFLCNAQEYFL